MAEDYSRLGRTMREHRMRLGLTQAEVASRAEVSERALINLEAGLAPKRGGVTATATRVAQVLDWPAGAIHRVLQGGPVDEDAAGTVGGPTHTSPGHVDDDYEAILLRLPGGLTPAERERAKRIARRTAQDAVREIFGDGNEDRTGGDL